MIRENGATSSIRGIVNIREDLGRPAHERHPAETNPTHYDLDMVITLSPDYSIDGNVTIENVITATGESQREFMVNVNSLNIDEASIELRDGIGNILPISEHIYDFERENQRVVYTPPSATDDFTMFYSASYTALVQRNYELGLYLATYKEKSNPSVTKEMATTQFETTAARWAFPCLDEPNKKATFALRIGRNDSFRSVSNMPQIATGDPVDGYPGYSWDVYANSVVMSSYLVAFSVADFVEVESEPLLDGLVFSNIARPDAVADNLTDLARDLGPAILESLEVTFQVLFPLPKMSQIGIPMGFGGAMENWGMITYIESTLVIDSDQSSASDKDGVIGTVAHEIGHQWFGDLVTTDWWDTIWLNEGYATYSSYFALEAVAPYAQNWNRFYLDITEPILRSDASPDSHQMINDVIYPGDADFGSITYNKGGSMARMMEHMLTTETYLKGMRNYLLANQYSTAVSDDLFAELTAVGNQDQTLDSAYDMKTIMDTWLFQKNFPLVTATRDYGLGEVVFSQSRFLDEPDTSGDTHDYQWYIPITYTLAGPSGDFNNTHNDDFLDPNSTLSVDIGINTDPLVVNIQNTGYYRVNYDTQNWDYIIDFLNNGDFNDIHQINRAQLLSDSYALAEAGVLSSYDIPERLAEYLPNETEYVPLSMALNIYQRLGNQGSLPPEALLLFNNLQTLILDKYNQFGLTSNPDDEFLTLLYKREVVDEVCASDYPACVSDAQAVFAQWTQVSDPYDPNANPINPNLRYPIYCTVVRNGGTDEVNFLSDVLDNTYAPHEYNAISRALNC